MELHRHICTQLMEKSKSFSQITLDDDYIVRDNKPDVVRVIYSRGDIQVEDVKAGNQGVWISGKLRFSVLYQSDDENHRLESVNGDVPFQEKVMMDDVEDYDDVTVDMNLEDLSVGIINSRKLSIRAVVNVTARNLKEEESRRKFLREYWSIKSFQERWLHILPEEWVSQTPISELLVLMDLTDTNTRKYKKTKEYYSRCKQFPKPIIVDSQRFVLDGFTQVLYAKNNKIKEIPTIVLENVVLIF